MTIFRWDTMKEVGPHSLRFKVPVQGRKFEVALTSGHTINVFRADDGQFFFCHGLTFGGTEVPGGAVSPFSGADVQTIIADFDELVSPESAAVAGNILVWKGSGETTPHSAILVSPVVLPGTTFLDYASLLRSKNGQLPEAVMTLRKLVDGPGSYGVSYNVFRLK